MPSTRARLTLVLALLACAVTVRTVAAESLEEAWTRALDVDRRLHAARARTAAASESLAAAQGNRYPTLHNTSTYTVLDNEPAFTQTLPPVLGQQLGTITVPIGDQYFGTSSTMLSVPLYTSGRISSGIDAAQSGLAATRTQETSTALDVKYDVATTYVGVLRLQHAVAVADSAVVSLGAYAQDVDNLYAHDLVARNDVLASQVALADARQRALQARSLLDTARAAYNRLLDRPFGAAVDLDDLRPDAAPLDVDALTARALRRRPELAGLVQKADALRQRADSVRASSLPQLALTGGFTYFQDRFVVDEAVWSGTVALNWAMFDGGVASHEAGALRQEAAATATERANLQTLIALDVRQLCNDITSARERIAVTREAVTQADENVRVARDRYVKGVGTNTEVLDAESRRTATRDNNDNAVYDAVLAGLRLRRAVGDL